MSNFTLSDLFEYVIGLRPIENFYIFVFFQPAETGNRTPNSGVKGSGANHYPRALATPHQIPAPLKYM